MNFSTTLLLAFVGFCVHGLPAALIGAGIGYFLDMRRHHQQRQTPSVASFVEPLFQLLGAIAKVDGRISAAEIAVAERMMARLGLQAEQRQLAIAGFNAGKQPGFDVLPAVAGLRDWVGGRRQLAFTALDVMMDTVLADGVPSAPKMAILRQVALALRVGEIELIALMAMKGYAWNGAAGAGHQGGTGGYAPPQRHAGGPDPYTVLGIGREADERAVKRAYRKLISEHHPDRLGDLPEDMRRRAEARASEINAAYERIKAERGFK